MVVVIVMVLVVIAFVIAGALRSVSGVRVVWIAEFVSMLVVVRLASFSRLIGAGMITSPVTQQNC
jgi:hypothetical protein